MNEYYFSHYLINELQLHVHHVLSIFIQLAMWSPQSKGAMSFGCFHSLLTSRQIYWSSSEGFDYIIFKPQKTDITPDLSTTRSSK